ncbi:hypothetical protein [Methylotenera sp.]|uniref:hypothetical protein n=1 Tax=Methylotenera sp. TaxID=2051956 RepID=UPI002ED93E64
MSIYNAKLKARQDQLGHEQKRKLAHAKVADLLRERNIDVINFAFNQINKWQENKLCSLDYIEEWSSLIKSPDKAADLLLEDSPRAIRLRQNTPFSAYLSI